MADTALRRLGAFDTLAKAAKAVPAAQMTPLPPTAAFILRGKAGAIDAAGTAFGAALPTEAYGVASNGERHALWLGPDEWLLLAPEAEGPAIAAAFALVDTPHSLVAVGERNVALEITGPMAQAVLNAGCPLDLHLSRFPVGACTRTLFGKAEIILWRREATRFYVGTWRSFAAYVWGLMTQARLEHEV